MYALLLLVFQQHLVGSEVITNVSSCSVDKFKSQLDKHLRNIVDLPCQSGFNNSLDGEDCLNGGH